MGLKSDSNFVVDHPGGRGSSTIDHKNIVDFVGIRKSPDEGVPSIVLQKACHGSVHAYLHQQKTPDAFVKLVRIPVSC